MEWLSPEHIAHQELLYARGSCTGSSISNYAAGIPPYLRGPYSTMYVMQPWTIRQYAGFSTAEESNAFYRRNLAAGQKGLSVAFDLATHRGYDSDHERVTGDVGKAGVAIDSILDMKILFDQIPLDQMSVSMTMNGAVLPIMAFYIVAAEEQGVAPEQLSGTIQNDILKEFMVRNTYIYPPEASMRIIGDIFRYCAAKMPQVQLHQRERIPHAGSRRHGGHRTGLHAGRRAGVPAHRRRSAGLDVDDFAPRISFFWGIGMNHFMEIAKMRAARMLWAKLVKQLQSEESEIAGSAHAFANFRLEPDRAGPVTTTWCAPASRRWPRPSGTRNRCTPTRWMKPWRCPPIFPRASRATRRSILQEETGITRIVDPWAGSYYVERLTHELMHAAWALIEEVEALGGMAKAIETGIPKMRIEEAAARRQARIDSGQRHHRRRQCVSVARRTADPGARYRQRAVRESQLARLAELKRERDPVRRSSSRSTA